MFSYDAIECVIKVIPQFILGFSIASWHECTFHIASNVYLGNFDLIQISWVVLPVPLSMILDSNYGTFHALECHRRQVRLCNVDRKPNVCAATLLLDEHIFDLKILNFVLNVL